MWMQTCISGMASGGVYGKGVGIAQLIMTETGSTMTMFQVSISTWIDIGELITETIVGTDTNGTTTGFLINNSKRTGGVGTRTNPGADKKPGVFRNTHLEHKNTRRC